MAKPTDNSLPPASTTLLVNQLDALRVSADILQMLTSESSALFRHIQPTFFQLHHPEIKLLLHMCLWYLYFKQQKALPGDLLQNIKYVSTVKQKDGDTDKDETQKRGNPSAKYTQSLSPSHKTLYILLATVLPYVWQKWCDALKFKENEIKAKSYQRMRRKQCATLEFTEICTLIICKWTKRIEGFSKVFQFLNLICFIATGKYRFWIDRLLSLHMVHISPSAQRQISFELMNRRFYWNSLTDFILVVLPFINIHQMKAFTKRYIYPYALVRLNQLKQYTYPLLHGGKCIPTSEMVFETIGNTDSGQSEPLFSTTQKKSLNKCIFCGIYPISMAFESHCGHPFCYWCIVSAQSIAANVMCPECGADITAMDWKRI